MSNKYNSRATVFDGIPGISYTLVLGAGGAAATPIVLGNDASGVAYPQTLLRGITTGYDGYPVNSNFQYNDQPILKAFGVFVNFADGLVWDDSDGPPLFLIQLVSSAVPNPTVARGTPFRLDSFNTMFPLDMVIDTSGARVLGVTTPWSVSVTRPAALCPEVTFYTNGISTAWNGRDVRFSYRAEFEHTFDLVA